MTDAASPTTSARDALNSAKLRFLVREHLGAEYAPDTNPDRASFGRGAALVSGDCAWVLLDQQPERGTGAALAWALKQPDITRLAIVADAATTLLARRAALFNMPIAVWGIVEKLLVPAIAETPSHETIDADDLANFGPIIQASGADVVLEHGVISGEVHGLEVCRVVVDPNTGAHQLEVGVGAHDRDAYLTMHANRPLKESLLHVVQAVRDQRYAGAPLHPLNRFCAERFLRWQALVDPALVGAASLEVAVPPVARPNLKDPVPCVATGVGADGQPLVVAFSVGVDLDVVPFAADARAQLHPAAHLRLVMPGRDILGVTRTLAQQVAGGNCDIIAWA